jgi:hypothetical protein
MATMETLNSPSLGLKTWAVDEFNVLMGDMTSIN